MKASFNNILGPQFWIYAKTYIMTLDKILFDKGNSNFMTFH